MAELPQYPSTFDWFIMCWQCHSYVEDSLGPYFWDYKPCTGVGQGRLPAILTTAVEFFREFIINNII